MRTTLLLALAIMIGVSGFAQKRQAQGKIALKPALSQLNKSIHPDEVSVVPGTTQKPKLPAKSATMVEMVPIGSSINAFTVQFSSQRCMAYDPSTNLIMATHRGDHATPGFATGNDIVAVFSSDNGNTWEETIGFTGNTTKRCRYPSGVLYNPAGNTDPNNVYSVTAGPVTDGSNWTFNFYGSVTRSGNNTSQYWEPTVMGEVMNNGMVSTDNGIVAIGNTQYSDDGNGYTGLIGLTEIGRFNGVTNAFDWSLQIWDPEEYIYFDTTNGWFRSWSASYQMCWSKDGSIGYRWTDGIDNRAPNGSSFYPIIFKTIDGGDTWTVLDFFDFGLLPEVYAHLINLAAEDRVAPWFQSSDGVVDYRGNLHLFGEVTSAVSLHPDSLYYYWTGDYGSLFEFEYLTEGNTWMATWCDSLRSTNPTSGTSGNSIYGTGADRTGWDKHLHASISPDGKVVFASWTDTDDYAFWGLSEPINMYPDIKVWARDLENNQHTEAMNKTYEGGAGAAWGACYFPFTAQTAIETEGGFILPASIVDIATNGYDPTLPVFHYYLKGIDVQLSDFILADKPEAKISGTFVGNISPNPVIGVSRLEVRLEKEANVSIAIKNISGQNISLANQGRLVPGIHKLRVDATNLSSGIYFCIVTVDDQIYTNKFIVN